MNRACVDTSVLIAIAFGEAGGTALARDLDGFDELFAANLLEAELRAAFVREAVVPDASLLGPLTWIIPDRPIGAEIERVLTTGYLRGADAWHLACALYLAPDPAEFTFLTLDDHQEAVAAALGFATG